MDKKELVALSELIDSKINEALKKERARFKSIVDCICYSEDPVRSKVIERVARKVDSNWEPYAD